jgi:putative CocE/NonD family hydrolase
VSSGPAAEDPKLKQKWFDHWLQGASNGVEQAPAVSFYPIGGTKWEHPAAWPPPNVDYRPYYLDGNASLTTDKPAQAGGDDTPLLPASSPCSRLTTQWTAGAAAGPCETDNRTFEATGLTYTTPPLKQDTQLTGPIVANVWAQLTTKDATLVGVVSDVTPDGASTQISAGFLLASQRKLDPERSWYGPGHVLIRPFHPFTQRSQKPVVPNRPTLYRIEIYPTDAIFKKGDQIRFTLNTANTPSTSAPVPDQLNSLGGTVRVLHGKTYASNVRLPVIR